MRHECGKLSRLRERRETRDVPDLHVHHRCLRPRDHMAVDRCGQMLLTL